MLNLLYNLATDKYQGFIFWPVKLFLLLLSFIYGLLARVLILLYGLKPQRLNCKVISVGNITLGGTGKTPLVEFIAQYLKREGHKVAILTRGYKRKTIDYRLSTIDYKTMGDEPYMLSKKLEGIPIIVDADRARGAEKAIKDYNADTIILDDGFQQWGIIKDLEIVTIDAANPFGNFHLLPRGILRQPLSTLKKVDLFVLTKTNLGLKQDKPNNFLSAINPKAQIFESGHKPVSFYGLKNPDELLSINALGNKLVTLVSGIGDPNSFEKLIFNLNIHIGLSFIFPDHHDYTQRDLDKIIAVSKEKGIDTIITTEKDAVRLCDKRDAISEMHILVLRIELEFKDEERFIHRLREFYAF